MRLTKVSKITAVIELVSGLHIGSGNTEIHIGGTDNPVIKNPVTNQPYIPGSSLKGKMRSLMEWRAGVVGTAEGKPLGFRHLKAIDDPTKQAAGRVILKLFGGAPDANPDSELVTEIGPTRLSFWDANLNPSWSDDMRRRNLLLTETKAENSIDRIRGVAEHPRTMERVPAGARFDFALTVRVHDDEDLLQEILEGLKLVELTGLGGSGSRGYGKIRFQALMRDDENIQARFDGIRFS
jgi:CRISPR-associated protein Csm3